MEASDSLHEYEIPCIVLDEDEEPVPKVCQQSSVQLCVISPDLTKIKICPTIEVLMNQNMCFKCGYPDCSWESPRNRSMVRHMQTHFTNILSTRLEMFYYCPEDGCSHSTDKDNVVGFKSFKYLRQHYAKVHGPKVFLCSHCGKGFGAQTYLNLHERMCGVSFVCSCTSSFSSLEALQTHARRRKHSFDLEKYRLLMGSRKGGQPTKSKMSTLIDLSQFSSASELTSSSSECLSSPSLENGINNIPSTESSETRPLSDSISKSSSESNCSSPSVTKSKLVAPLKTPHVNVPILPKPGPDARIVVYQITSSVFVDCGTQTIPLIVRKRSATQHSQTESKITKTRGTLTTPPAATVTNEVSTKQPKRKTSAQTQTKRIKISTETQTPVVTKRKRSIRKKHITTATTQTNTAKIRTGQHVAPIALTPSPATSSSSQIFHIFESFDEVHSQTQTDPNPFFGYRGSERVGSPDSFFSVDKEIDARNSLETMSRLKTSETQTLPTKTLTRFNGSGNIKQSVIQLGQATLFFDSSQNDSNFPEGDESVPPSRLSEDLNNFDSYLETMDNETQTCYFDNMNQFLY